MRLPRYQFVFRHSVASTSDPGTYIPKSIFESLLASGPGQKTTRAVDPKIENDWRHGNITVEWIDLPTMSSAVELSGRKGGQSVTRGSTNPIASFTPSTINDNLKSGTTNLPKGVVHIFREKFLVSDGESSPTPDSETLDDKSTEQGVVLAILAVPSYMTPSDFLNFVAPAADGILHLRMIRDSVPSRSMVLMKFRTPEDASEFAEAYNGREFNSLQAEICQVVNATSVKIEAHDEASLVNARLSSPQDPMHELPTCPVCLERMDSSVTGLVTVPCLHTFHCTCLTKWGDSRCPVCRYSQNLMSTHRHKPSSGSRSSTFAGSTPPSLTSCWDCSSTTNLWICLICGNVGCGRYGRAHAQGHYQSTTHLYALELETQRVWDYAGDGYVHRLIQNKADGKLVELPSASSMNTSGNVTVDGSRSLGPGPSDNLTAEKIEAIGIEYSYLLTSQLDSQREYFEQQQSKLLTELERYKAESAEVKALAQHEAELQSELATRERQKAEKKAEKAAELARKFEKELKEERTVSEGLFNNITVTKSKLDEVTREKREHVTKIADLEEQLRDLMFYLEAKEKIAQGEDGLEDAVGGSIEVRATPKSRRGRTNKGKG